MRPYVARGGPQALRPLLLLTVLFVWTLAAGWTAIICAQWLTLYAHETGPRLPDGSPYGRDFLQFVYVADAWQTGTLDRLYDRKTQIAALRRLGQPADDYPLILRYNYPPFFAWLPRVLGGLTYRAAYVAWLGLQLGFLLLAVAAWRRELADRPALFWLLVALVVVSPFVPFNLMIGQTGFIGLAALSWACRFLRTGRDLAAGLCIATLLYKPPLGIVIGPLLLLKRRWRVVGGVAVGATGLLLLSLLVSARALVDYPAAVRAFSQEMATEQYGLYNLQYDLLSFVTVSMDDRLPRCLGRIVRLIPAPHGASGVENGVSHSSCSFASLSLFAALAVITVMALVLAWRDPSRTARPRKNGVTDARLATLVLGTLLLSPYLFFYDTVLLAVAGVYTLRTLPARPAAHAWLVLAFTAVAFVWIGGLTQAPNLLPVRLQLATLAFLSWLWLEAVVAAKDARA